MRQPPIHLKVRLASGPRHERRPAPVLPSAGGPGAHPLLALQRAAGNDAVVRLLQRGMPPAGVAPRGQDEALEREADRLAGEASRAEDRGKAVAAPKPPAGEAGRGGAALPEGVRRRLERGYAHDFRGVRVHTDAAAGSSARMLGARAYTVGQDIVFAPGEYQPGTVAGQELLAHELAHVVQQSAARTPRLQRRLVATGDSVGFVEIANALIGAQYEVSVLRSGTVQLRRTQSRNPLTHAASVLVDVLRRIINDSSTTTIAFVHRLRSKDPSIREIILGSYELSAVDLDSIVLLREGPGFSTISVLIHELQEQYRKQVHGEAYEPAHESAVEHEEQAIGARRLWEEVRHIDADTMEISVLHGYPDGTLVEVILTFTKEDITSVARKVTTPRTRPGGTP